MSLQHSPARQGRAAFSIAEFCERNAISRSMFYKMRGQGIGPRLMSVGTRQLITAAAELDWQTAREAATRDGGAAARLGRPPTAVLVNRRR